MKKNYSLNELGATMHEFTLDNGLKVIFIEKPFAPIYAEIEVKTGTVFNPSNNGLAHFVEHILVSEKKQYSRNQFSKIINSIGGHSNAHTSASYISVEAKVASSEFLPALKEYLSLSVNEIYITEESLQKEKNIILSEIERKKSAQDYEIKNRISELFCGGTVWNYSNLGETEAMLSITKEDVIGFFNTYFVVENMTLLISGGCTVSDIQKTFSDIVFKNGVKSLRPDSPKQLDVMQRFYYYDDVPQSGISVAFNAPQVGTRESIVLNFALEYAHTGLDSLFFSEIREKRGLAYHLSNFRFIYGYTQYVGTGIGVPTKSIDTVIDVILETYQKILDDGISQEEIDAAVLKMWNRAKIDNEKVSTIVGLINYPYPNVTSVVGHFPDIYNLRQSITEDEVKAVLKKYITLDSFHLLMDGREKSVKYM